jgi:hypothetical protein
MEGFAGRWRHSWLHLVLEEVPEIGDSDSSEKEDYGDTLEEMYGPGCPSLDQARRTEEQDERLRKGMTGGLVTDSVVGCQET